MELADYIAEREHWLMTDETLRQAMRDMARWMSTDAEGSGHSRWASWCHWKRSIKGALVSLMGDIEDVAVYSDAISRLRDIVLGHMRWEQEMSRQKWDEAQRDSEFEETYRIGKEELAQGNSFELNLEEVRARIGSS
jgi:hypothetical protein